MDAALSLYSRVVALDDSEIVAQLGWEGIIEVLYQPLKSECEVVQLDAMQILLRVLVADEAFLRTALDSGVVQQPTAHTQDARSALDLLLRPFTRCLAGDRRRGTNRRNPRVLDRQK
jgi:hypothetical protein